MKNNIKRAPVKFREDGLYFQHFMLIFVFVSDYHHLNFSSIKNKGENLRHDHVLITISILCIKENNLRPHKKVSCILGLKVRIFILQSTASPH